MQDVRVDYEDPEGLQWNVITLNTDVIPLSYITFNKGGNANFVRLVPLKSVTGVATIRVT